MRIRLSSQPAESGDKKEPEPKLTDLFNRSKKHRSHLSLTETTVHSATAVSRHDHHNIEIKSVIEMRPEPLKVVNELYVFIPKSFEIGLAGKSELVKDLRTRLRLAIPSNEGFDDKDFTAALTDLANANARLEAEALVALATAQEVPANLREGVLEAAKDVASIVAERLKRLSVEHGRQFFISQSLLVTASSRAAGFDLFVKNLQSVRRRIELLRETMRTKSRDGRSLNSLLDEFLSQIYVQYLGSIASEFGRYEADSTDRGTSDNSRSVFGSADPSNGPPGAPALGTDGSTLDSSAAFALSFARAKQMLKALQEDEAVYRKSRGLSFESETDLERERHLIRLSQLKKFFQSKTFIDVAKTQAAKKISESTALVGTAVAGVAAAVLEQWGRKNVATLASQGLMLVSLGVILYVIRDRMKDWARNKLHEKALGLIPDFETELTVGKRRFGVSKEWFQLLASKQCDGKILEARHADSLIERSLRLPEDVIFSRRVFMLEPCGVDAGPPRALHENTRLNLDRHLKFMDDPFKELTDLEADGNFTLSRSHRVYHFYVVTKTSVTTGPDAEPSRIRTWMAGVSALLGIKNKPRVPDAVSIGAHRVVLDKSGIVRVEPISL